MWPWTTKPVLSRWGLFVAIAKNTLYGSKLLIFFMPKIIRILSRDHDSIMIFCKFLTVNISKLSFHSRFWEVICIAKNFIWTTLKAIFFILLRNLNFEKLTLKTGFVVQGHIYSAGQRLIASRMKVFVYIIYMCVYCIYLLCIQSWSKKISAPLVNMIKEGCENESSL